MDLEAFLGRPLACLPAPAVTVDGTLSAADGGEAAAADGVDRISALPDDLRRRIVSRLPIKDAVRTTTLSTRWRRVWHSTPLVLYDSHLDPGDPATRAVAAVDRVLEGHDPGPFHTVHLALIFFDEHERELGQWSRLLADRGVRDLALVSLLGGAWGRFPDTADLTVGTGVFPHLRELAIVYTFFEDCDLDHMLASSPVLEKLALFVNFGKAKHVRLHGQKLQCVLVWEIAAFEVVVVDAPRLERLIMWGMSGPSKGDGSLMEVKIAEGVSALKSARADEPTGYDYLEFFKELSPIECFQSHIKMVVLQEIYGDLSEVTFIKYMTQRANELKKMRLVFSDERRATVGEMKYILQTLAIPPWASETCTVSLMAPKNEAGLDFHRTSDLYVEDPFLEHGQELFHFIKEGE
nr:unnamed protein product [Digitaria exilis]